MRPLILLLHLFLLSPCFGQSLIRSSYIDSLAAYSLEELDQAGFAIGVIQNGEITHLKGYGVSSAETGEQVNEHTLFAIASNSKAFTTTALGILVDQGKLAWDDKVIDFIPEFRMYDPYVTANFTIVDLLTHRSGLGLGAGDLMFFPDGADFTVDDVIASFQHQEPVSPFRTKYDYDNLLYIVAGEIIHRVSGKPWDQFVEEEIMDKLGMNRSRGIYQNIEHQNNVAAPHGVEDGEVMTIPPYTKPDGSLGAAGGIYSSVSDMCQWMLMHLQGGLHGENLEDTLLSNDVHQDLWTIHTNISFSAEGDPYYNNHFNGYGLGFFLEDRKGYTIVQHSGGLPGMLSMVTMIPELDAGIVILTNCSPGGMEFLTLSNELIDDMVGASGRNWVEMVKFYLGRSDNDESEEMESVWEQVESADDSHLDLENYAGAYRDPWFGQVYIRVEDDGLWFHSVRSPRMRGKLHYYGAHTWVIDWNFDTMECDAYVTFQLDENGMAQSIDMKGVSPILDFSYDYHDLRLERMEE